jgi:NADH-quinone oxidoreductase subunit M
VLKQAPHLGWILGFCAMASLGLPGLAGFWGEFPAILSAYEPMAGMSQTAFRVFMVVAALGTVLAAGYLLWMFQRVAFGEPKAEFADAHIHDVHGPEWIAWAPMLALIIAFGVFPSLLFNVSNPAVCSSTVNIQRAANVPDSKLPTCPAANEAQGKPEVAPQ